MQAAPSSRSTSLAERGTYSPAPQNATVGAAGLSGYLDGTNILSGTFSGGDTIIGAQGATNPGNITLAGTFVGAVTMTDLAVITPS